MIIRWCLELRIMKLMIRKKKISKEVLLCCLIEHLGLCNYFVKIIIFKWKILLDNKLILMVLLKLIQLISLNWLLVPLESILKY